MAAVMDYLFQRTLDDLVKGLRVQSIGESRYVAQALEEVRKEIRSTDGHTKSVALQKLAYLSMLHACDMSWAAFHIVEVMSLPAFAQKKIGYSAASQSFRDDTEVVLLTTNLFRKDLSSKNEHEAGMALECLSRIATSDLARDLTPDVFTMLASSRMHIRKKATLVLLRIFSKYPDAIRIAFKRLVEKLDDTDSQVVAAAVSVLLELSRKDPRPYLPLAPHFYRLLVESTSNWLCIKLVKLFALLLPLEPRLGKKIVEPLCQQMRRTGAKSLIFECVRTIAIGLLEHTAAVELAAQKLKEILSAEPEQEDANLKYLGLQALLKFMPTHRDIVASNKSVILKCLNDADPSVQRSALRLVTGMLSDSNVVETVQILIRYARTTVHGSFSNELVAAILSKCSSDFYDLVTDFAWYVNVLGELVRLQHFEQGQEVERQLVDIGLRVKSVRKDLVKLGKDLLLESSLWDNSNVHRVLAAAAWLVGEYVQLSSDPFALVEALLQPRLRLLPSEVQAVCLHAVMKILVFFEGRQVDPGHVQVDPHPQVVHGHVQVDAEQVEVPEQVGVTEQVLVQVDDTQGSELVQVDAEQVQVDGAKTDEAQENGMPQPDGTADLLNGMAALIRENVGCLLRDVDTEVQERATNLIALVNLVEINRGSELYPVSQAARGVMQRIFSSELYPVSQAAQGRVPVPEGLELLDNLDDVREIVGEPSTVETSNSPSLFATRKEPESQQQQQQEEADIDEHRQRNSTYYLPKETEPLLEDKHKEKQQEQGTSSQSPSQKQEQEVQSQEKDKFKVAEEALVWTNCKRPKARPAVIRLMDEEDASQASNSVKVDNDGTLSSAIRDALSGGASPSAVEEIELRNKKKKKKKHRHRAKNILDVVPQSPVVPDFLL